MKQYFAAAVVATMLSGCGMVAPDAGQEAVLVQKPYFFGHGGVVDEPITTGRSFIALSTQEIYVDVKPVQWDIPFNDLMTKDGVPIHFDAAAVVQVTDSVKLIERFGTNWFANNLETVIRNKVRQAVRKHGMNEVAIDTVAIDAVDAEVASGVRDYLKASGLPVRLVRFTVGKANPPDSIKTQRVATAREEQRQKTEDMSQKAEVARKAAEQARAEADNAYRQQMSLSPEQFVKLQEISMIEKVCVNGGCTFVNGNAMPIIGGR